MPAGACGLCGVRAGVCVGGGGGLAQGLGEGGEGFQHCETHVRRTGRREAPRRTVDTMRRPPARNIQRRVMQRTGAWSVG